MLLKVNELTKFIELAGIGIGGLFEAHSDKFLNSSVANGTNTILLEVEMNVNSDEVYDFYFIREMAVKYLKNFKDVVNIKANKDTIELSDGKLVIYMPQGAVDKSQANTRRIAKALPPMKTTFVIKVEDLAKILAVAKSADDSVIKIDVEEKSVTFLVGNKAKLVSESTVTGEPPTSVFLRIDTIEGVLLKADRTVTFESTNDMNIPVKFSFESGNIGVSGYIAPFVPEVAKDAE